MAYARSFIFMIVLICLSACSIHPIPDTPEGGKTMEIVTKIRCEARRAIEEIAIDLLRRQNLSKDNGLARQLQEDLVIGKPFSLTNIDAALTPKTPERIFYEDYVNTGVAFNFTFDITEVNNNDSEIDVGRIVTGGTASVVFKANADLSREGTRHFIVSNSFKGILTDPKLNAMTWKQAPGLCPTDAPSENIVYPVTGTIGLHEVFSTFVDLNTNEDLALAAPGSMTTTESTPAIAPRPKSKVAKTATPKSGGDVAPPDDTHKVPVMADTLVFTTTFEGSANPLITLNAKPGLDITKGSLTGDHKRTDKNTVIIGLSYAPIEGASPPRLQVLSENGIVTPIAPAARTVFARKNSNSAVENAVNATIEQQFNTYIQSVGRLPPNF